MAVDKSVDSGALDTMFKNIGNAIREKDGSTDLITPGNMPAKIRAIQTGIDTSDATATENDIVSDKTAYVNGKKVTGNLHRMAQINVGSEAEKITPSQSSAGMFVEGPCEVSGNTLIDRTTTVVTYIYIPGDAAPDSVLEGTTFSSEDYIEATGTMPDNGEASFELSNLANVDVAEGYYSGGTAKIADAEAAKIIPGNIKKGVTILGVRGTLEASTADANIGKIVTEQTTGVKIDTSRALYLGSTALTSWLSNYNVRPVAVYLVNSGDDVTGGTTNALYTANLAPAPGTNKFLCIETYIKSSGGYGVSRSTAASGALSVNGTNIYVQLVGAGTVSSKSALTAYVTYVLTSRKQ